VGQSWQASARSTANRSVVEAAVAAATALQTAFQRFAAGLQDRAAGLIAARAGDAATVLGVFAFANAEGQVALTDRQAVERGAARA
jgi:hypothetical protein